MDLFDILLVKKLIGKISSGEITSPEAQVIGLLNDCKIYNYAISDAEMNEWLTAATL